MAHYITSDVASIILKIDDPARDDLTSVKVWASTTSGFTPSDSNLVFNGKSLDITIPDLVPLQQYYVRYAFISEIDPADYEVSVELSATPTFITESEISEELNSRIDLIDADATVAGSVNQRVASEASIRAGQIQLESHERLISVQEAAYAALQATVAANNERTDRVADVALARTELNENLQDGLLAEASQRTILAAQLRGNYSGTDLNQVTSGLIYEEKLARAQQDSALALSISLLSAGVGEQFDWKNIWYFDTGVDGWTGNGTPTQVQGFLRPANQASDAYVISPSAIAVDTSKYQEIRLRIRKGGNPTFAGYIWWKATGQSFDVSRRISISAPTFDAQNIAVITLSVPWTATATVDQIRLDLSSAQTSTDYFEIDWFAVGRPSPAASTAQILDEAAARTEADNAEATKRETLSTFLFGANEPGSLNLDTITSGLIYDEKTARVNAVSAVVEDVEILQGEVLALNDPVTGTVTLLQGEVTEISQVVVDLESVSSSRELELKAQSKKLDETAETTLRNALTGEKNKVKSEDEIALARQELQANIVEGLSAEAFSRLQLEAKVDNNNANIISNYYTKSTTDSIIAQKAEVLRAYSNLSSKTFTQSTAPVNRGLDPETFQAVPLQIGDLWINTADDNSQSRWDGSAWVSSTDESSLSTFITDTYDPAIQNLSDSKIESWFSTTDPSLSWTGGAFVHAGDLWYNSDTKLFKRWNGDSWVTIEDQVAIDAATAASNAQSTADGKITTFAQSTQPTAEGIGDLWIDTDDNNKPYRWNGTVWVEIRDGAIAAVDARVTTVETTKIGYCTIGGNTTEHGDKSACELAGGTWNIGLPWATAVKQVSVTDPEGNSASIEDSFEAIKTVNDGLKASKVVKIDVNNRIAGYGLYADETISEFITSVDRFAVASPDTSVALWQANTAYSFNNCVRVSGDNAKMLVCKTAGTSGVTAPSTSGAIGSTVTDGTVIWQVASRVPFSVVSATTTIGGVTVPPGVYVDGALIVNETINNQQVANEAITSSKVKELTASKISTGTLAAGTSITIGTPGNSNGGIVIVGGATAGQDYIAQRVTISGTARDTVRMGYLGNTVNGSTYGFQAKSTTGSVLFDSRNNVGIVGNTTYDNYNVGDETTNPYWNTDANGTENIAIGSYALNFQGASSRNNNIAIGKSALRNLDSGARVIAIGKEAAQFAQVAEDSVSMGYRAGRYGITNSIAIGNFALAASSFAPIPGISGTNCVAIGYAAGYNESDGSSNVYVGSRSGGAAFGLNKGEGASGNVAVGSFTLGDIGSGTNNVAIGENAGRYATDAQQNVFVGANSGDSIVSGIGNTFIGYNSDVGTDVSSNVVISNSTEIVLRYNGTSWSTSKDFSANNVKSGTYTPTLTNTTNVSSSTAYFSQYSRVGSIVTVSGRVDVTATASGINTVLEISLPIASNLSSSYNCGGTAAMLTTNIAAAIYANTTDDRAILRFTSESTSSRSFYFQFMYRII